MVDSRHSTQPFRDLHWRYLKRSSALVVGVPFLAVFGTACAALALALTFKHRAFDVEGVQTTATVVRKESKSEWHGMRGNQKRRTTKYYLDTKYQDLEAELHQARVHVPMTVYQRTQVADTVAIEYLPADPGRARLVERTVRVSRGNRDKWVYRRESVDEAEGSRVLGGLALLLLGGAALIVTLTVRSAGRQARLVLTGVAVLGRVRQVVKSAWNNNGRQYVVVYEFQSAEGRTYAGRSRQLSELEQSRWQSGDDIRIVYDPHHPTRHEIDAFDIRATTEKP